MLSWIDFQFPIFLGMVMKWSGCFNPKTFLSENSQRGNSVPSVTWRDERKCDGQNQWSLNVQVIGVGQNCFYFLADLNKIYFYQWSVYQRKSWKDKKYLHFFHDKVMLLNLCTFLSQGSQLLFQLGLHYIKSHFKKLRIDQIFYHLIRLTKVIL